MDDQKSFTILGVHRIEASDGCYLFEVELSDPAFDWESVTQEIEGERPENWQVAWDERHVGENRWVFFFHRLNLSKPLMTDHGSVQLPQPTPLPTRLCAIKYESPC